MSYGFRHKIVKIFPYSSFLFFFFFFGGGGGVLRNKRLTETVPAPYILVEK